MKLWDAPWTSKMRRPKLSIYKTEVNNTGISVIICPGGSYFYTGIKDEGEMVAKWLNKNGISAFVLHYRVGLHGNHHPAMIQDLQRAIQLVKEDSAEYGISPEKVGVMGFSAGGHLAGIASTYFDINFLKNLNIEPKVSLRPAFVAMIYPVISMNDSIAHKKSRRNLLSNKYTKEEMRMMSLELNVRSDMPPVFLIQCKKDKTVDYRNSECYSHALSMKGVPYKYKLYDEPGHGFGINMKRGYGQAPMWNQDFIPWLEEIFQIQILNISQK